MQIAGVGEVVQWAEFWLLIYDGCGHETYFSRTGRQLYEPDKVESHVRTYYATCDKCRYDLAAKRFAESGR